MEEIGRPITARDMPILGDREKPGKAAVKTASNSRCSLIILPMEKRLYILDIFP